MEQVGGYMYAIQTSRDPHYHYRTYKDSVSPSES